MSKATKTLAAAILVSLGISAPVFAMGNSHKDTTISPEEDSLGTDRTRSETGSYAGTQVPEQPKEPDAVPVDSSTDSTEATPKYSK